MIFLIIFNWWCQGLNLGHFACFTTELHRQKSEEEREQPEVYGFDSPTSVSWAQLSPNVPLCCWFGLWLPSISQQIYKHKNIPFCYRLKSSHTFLRKEERGERCVAEGGGVFEKERKRQSWNELGNCKARKGIELYNRIPSWMDQSWWVQS